MKAGLIFLLALIFSCYSVVFAQKAEDPVAVDDSVTMMQYATIHINVLANDYDPNEEAIHIDEVDDAEGFEISFQDSIVTITTLVYYDWERVSIRYRIENESGESDRADIDIYFEENPDVPKPIEDFIELECQTEQIVNLVENDEYNGSEDLVISEVTDSQYFEIEIQPDQQSVKISARIYSGPFRFAYRIKENGGNEYESKRTSNTVFIKANENAPIGNTDSFFVNRGEIKVLDVLVNDISNSTLVIDTFGLPDHVQIIEDQLSFVCADSIYSFQDLSFKYYAIDENGLKSQQTDVNIIVPNAFNAPVAVDDMFEVDLADTLVFDVLQNDSSFMEHPLVLANGESIVKIAVGSNIHFGWQGFTYQCKNEGEEYLSNEAIGRYYLRHPDGIELPEINFQYKIGETLEFNPKDYNNVPDSMDQYWTHVTNDLGSLSNSDSIILRYNCQPGVLAEYLFENDSLFDQIGITYYHFFEDSAIYYHQVFNISYENANNYSVLHANNFSIPVSPFGMTYSLKNKPKHQFIEAESDGEYNYFLELIRPWLALEYDESERLTISADVYNANNYFAGPAVDQFSTEYDYKYFRTWKVSKEQIDEHLAHFQSEDYQIPEVIENWPAGPILYNGLEYEQADFVDVNQNSIYDPENGDFPIISGDEAILFIINDLRSYPGYPSGNSYADSLNIDIYGLVYAFDRPESDLFQNTVFIKYKIINKSNIDYQDFRFAQYVENSLFSVSDFIGCDTGLNTFYRYPFSQNMEQFTSSMTLLNEKMGKFLTFGDTDITDQALYSNMMGTYGDPFYFWHPPIWKEYAPLDYVFPGKIDDIDSWNNFTHWNDVQTYGVAYGGVMTSESMDFDSGDSKYFEYAFSVNYQTEQDYFDFVNTALDRAAQLIECYQNDSVPGGGSFTGIEPEVIICYSGFNVYPNPASTTLYVEGGMEAEGYSIYTLQGQRIEESVLRNEISIEHLPKGFYLLQLRGEQGDKTWTTKFVKQ